MKRCACGILYTEKQWARLRGCPDNVSTGLRIESRHCTCGSTLARLYCAACGVELGDDAAVEAHVPMVLRKPSIGGFDPQPVCAPKHRV